MKIKISNSMLNVLLGALASGILFMSEFPHSPKFLISTCAALIAISLLVTWRRKNLTAWLVAPIIFFTCGAWRFLAVDAIQPDDISKFTGEFRQVVGIVRDEPQIKILPNGLTQVRFIVDAETVKIKGEFQKISGGFILTAYPKAGEQIPSARIGDRISTGGNLKRLTNYNNPGQIDGVTRMKADGITARMSSSKIGVKVEAIDDCGLWTKFLRTVAEIRQHYRESMSQVMSAEDAAAIFA
ncbi:MAG: DUF4131 domain-containing protein, partial [Selenomonadaceae bacterium]|nr:DUF4131 domain-containing protein [Selenomonadaceae bacterium]